MKQMIYLFISIFLLKVILSQQQCQRKCVSMNYYDCKICYCSSQNNKLQSCVQYYCPFYSCYASQYKQRSYNQQTCLFHCCGQDSSLTEYNQQTINKCLDNNESQYIVGTVILVIILLGVPVFCVCFFTYRKCRTQNTYNNQNYQVNQQSATNLVPVKKLQWCAINTSQPSFNNEQNCTICLSPFTEVQTQCRHYFHYLCLKYWLEKKNICPNCSKVNIQKVKYFCNGCRRQYIELNIKNYQNTSKFQAQLMNQQCNRCNSEILIN